ncbi:hypothetical protein VX159_12085 [Dechloromonas sp. ZY10]|uniref:hypothetical protein n=1 Tax=Dechloromonas aquae TaxID=2664436 RepID=UPI003528AD27
MRLRLLPAFLLLLATSGHAETSLPGGVQFNGFGSIGLTRSSSRQAAFVRDLGQAKGSRGDWRSETDSLLGLQASWQVNPQLALVAQGISRYRVGNNYNPELMSAFVRYEPDARATLRVGRMPTDFYLFSDSRHIGYSYLTVRPSGDFFGALPFAHFDGTDLQLAHPLGDSLLRGKLYWGYLDEELPLAERRWPLRGSQLSGGNLSLQQGPWTLRLSTTLLHFRHNLPIAEISDNLRQLAPLFPAAGTAAERLEVAGAHSRFHSLGVVYDDGPLQFQAMLSRATHSTSAFQNWQAGYLQVGYRRGTVTPFIGHSWIRSNRRTLESGLPSGVAPAFDLLNAGVASVLADSHSAQQTTTLGLRWDLASQFALKIQYDMIRGKPDSIFPYRDETRAWNGRTQVLSAVLDFIF